MDVNHIRLFPASRSLRLHAEGKGCCYIFRPSSYKSALTELMSGITVSEQNGTIYVALLDGDTALA
jgi:hypothetical protein